jgi:uncharacterized protein (TIGR02996 family)
MANPADLEARLLANPDDLDAYLVYGDWLTEQGDPRGELVVVQTRAEQQPGNADLAARANQILAERRADWLGSLANMKPEDFTCEWKRGFIHSARIGPDPDKYETSEIDFVETIGELLVLPQIKFLRSLTIGGKYYDDYPVGWDEEVSALIEAGIPEGLQRLSIDCGGYWDISATELDNLPELFPHLGKLHELHVHMGMFSIQGIDLPSLRVLDLETNGLTKKDLEALRKGNLPNLEKVVLCLGETGGDYGGDIELDDLKPIFAAQNLGKVRHLGLANSSYADEIAGAIADSEILPRLRTLDLSRGTLGDEGARAILARADKFEHLEVLDLSRSYLSPAVIEQLGTLGPKVITEKNQGATDADDRYVSISE